MPGENSGEIKFQLGDAYELVSYDRIQVTVTEKDRRLTVLTASTDESQEGQKVRHQKDLPVRLRQSPVSNKKQGERHNGKQNNCN